MASSKPATLYPKKSWVEKNEKSLILFQLILFYVLFFSGAFLVISFEAPRLVGL